MSTEERYRRRSRYYVLVLLSAGYALNLLDRQIVGILLEPIRREFSAPDVILGLLVGPTFAAFYATLGMPIAWLADRFNRRNIIAASLALFSLMTAASGLAVHFWQLLLARVVTGVGEAGAGPASQSIISDMFAPKERAWAQSLYAAGSCVGVMVAFLCGGWIAEYHGWRTAFLVAGAPGLVLAALLAVTIGEPRRGAEVVCADRVHVPPFAQTVRFLWSQRSFRFIVLGASMSAFTTYSVMAFVPAFLARSHEMRGSEIGLVLAIILGFGGFVGTALPGYLADRLSARDARWNVYVPAIASGISLPFWLVFFLAHSKALAIGAAVVPLSLTTAWLGPCYAMAQSLVPVRMRATASSIVLFVCNSIGLGLGPLIVGAASDLLRPIVGSDSLRYALMASIVATLLAVIFYYLAAEKLRLDLVRAAEAGGSAA
jgi:predicted MFS family arabinose efflux permease